MKITDAQKPSTHTVIAKGSEGFGVRDDSGREVGLVWELSEAVSPDGEQFFSFYTVGARDGMEFGAKSRSPRYLMVDEAYVSLHTARHLAKTRALKRYA